MDRQIRRVGIAIVVLFAMLFAQLAYVQVFAADRIENNAANTARQIIAEYRTQRGAILSADGRLLAVSRPTTGALYRYQRRYPQGPLFAAITGYYSRQYGRSGLEQSMNAYLSGTAPELAASTFTDLLLGRPKQGGSVVTTLLPSLQEAAQQALGSLPGAVVAMDPATGDILAMVANPTYDPNKLSGGSADQVTKYWSQLIADPDKPLISRAKDELYLPGSTFKMITASGALENGYGPLSMWPNPHQLPLPLTSNSIENFGNELCLGGVSQVAMADAFRESCNVTFAEIGLKLGAEKLAAQARAYGFCPTDPPAQVTCISPTIPFVMPFQTGRFPIPEYFQKNTPLLAYSAIGLDNDLTNPLHMALVTSAIANGGNEMQPRLVTQIRDPEGRVVRSFPPVAYGTPISAKSAAEMRQMMIGVVNAGTGYSAQIPGIQVAGKTGTATNGPGKAPNAWFDAFAPAGPGDVPRIAVAVIVLDGGSLGSEATGGRVAAPIAKLVIEAYCRITKGCR
jgi:penicillin-binding protein A